MPPAFLFPESDPPPSDLVPEHSSSQSSSNTSGAPLEQQQQLTPSFNQAQPNPKQDSDSTDASPSAILIKSMSKSNHQLVEEYTLPDLFPNPPLIHSFPPPPPLPTSNNNNNKDEPSTTSTTNAINNTVGEPVTFTFHL
jgi:hypothetical protein